MERKLCYYYDWTSLQKEQYPSVIREFLDNGAHHFVLTDPLLGNMIRDSEWITFLKQVCQKMQVDFSAVHGICGRDRDLDVPVAEDRETLLREHIRGMEIASEFGCREYVVHVGAYYYIVKHTPLGELRKLCIDTLEKLLPTAEKLDMVLAVENSFEPPNSAAEVLGIMKHFKGHPCIGVCYDTGHAHCREYTPGKEISRYEPYFKEDFWETGIIYENDALETLKDYIVTCHIHDNTGYGDYHSMPFDGTIDWKALMPQLFACPRMRNYQTEVTFEEGINWAGHLAAPAGGYSIRRLTDTFRYLGF